MEKKGFVTFISAIIIVLLIVVIFSLGQSDNGNSANVVSETGSSVEEGNGGDSQTFVVEMTASGFSPSVLEISQGDTVTWMNKDSVGHWPASAIHPTHTVYPGSDIRKCRTSEADEIFDSCRPIAPGESYSFTFNEAGSWGYHDHVRASLTGKVIVN